MSAQRATQLVEAGLFLRLSGDLEGARRLFEQALKLDPTNARARHLLEGGAPASAPAPGAARAAPAQAAALASPLGAPPPAPRQPEPVAPASGGGGGGFEADWGMAVAMDAPAAGDGWSAPRVTSPVAPMGAPTTTTMAFPLSQAREQPMGQPQRAPMGAPITSTMAYPMQPQPGPGSAPVASGWTPPPIEPSSQGWGAPLDSTVAYSMGPQPGAEQPPPADPWAQGAQEAQGAQGTQGAQAGSPWDAQQPADQAGWGSPPTSTIAFSMGPMPGAPQPLSAAPPSSADGWGAPPTSSLGFPMPARQAAPEPPPAPPEQDPWTGYRAEGEAAPQADAEAAIWNQVSLAPPPPEPLSYAPPAVEDPYSAPAPAPAAEDDWSDVGPQPAASTAPQGLASNAPAPQPAPQPEPEAGPAEVVPWDHTEPLSAPPRPRPRPVAFADWAQPNAEPQPAPLPGGPWSVAQTPLPVAGVPPSSLQPLAPVLPPPVQGAATISLEGNPAPEAAGAASADGLDVPIVDEEEEIDGGDDEPVLAQPPPPLPPPAPIPVRPAPRAEVAIGIPEASGWGGDSLDSDFVEPMAAPDVMTLTPAPQAAQPFYVPEAPTLSPPAAPSAPVVMGQALAPSAPPPIAPLAGRAPAVPAPAPPPAPAPEPPLITQPRLLTDAQSAWDSSSNPGYKLPSDAVPKKGDVFDLIQKDDQARKPVAPEPDKKERLAQVLRKAKDLLDLDDHTGAMALINEADALAPNDAEVKRLKEKSEATLQRMYESKIGDLSRVPRVKLKETEIIWLNLDHRAGFMLAQVDGGSSFEDLFALSGMSRLDTARILAQLIDEGIIVV